MYRAVSAVRKNKLSPFSMKKLTTIYKKNYKPFLDFLKGKKVYLALSGGGLSLVCHISVVRFLQELDISIDRVYGTSAGAVVGGLFAAGLDFEKMKEAVNRLKDPDDLFGRGSKHLILRAVTREFQLLYRNEGFRGASIYNGERLEQYLGKVIMDNLGKDIRLGELQIPFSAVAFNIGSGKAPEIGLSVKEVFSTSRTPDVTLREAIVASISIPGIFPPKKIDRYYYIDGGVVEHLPIVSAYEDWLKEKKFYSRGVVILAVNLGYGGIRLLDEEHIRPHDMVLYAITVQGKTIDQYSLLRVHRPRKGSSVVLLKPRCYDIGLTDFEKIKGAIEKSYSIIQEQLKGNNFLRETEEDILKARVMLGLGEKF